MSEQTRVWPSVSVLIATRDRPRALERCIASVLRCDYPRFDVVVVDQGDQVAALPTDPRLTIIRQRDLVGKSRALNDAMAIATGAIFAFTDDDCTVPVDWLKRGVGVLEEGPAVGLVFGALTAMPHDPEEAFVPTFLPEERLVLQGVSSAHIRGGAGANMFTRRDVMGAIGGFDHLLGPGTIFKACEEYDVFYRALRAGFGVARDPDTKVVHWGARPMADGSGPRLLRDYYFGEGVVLGKHARAGDRQAARLAIGIFAQELNWACRGALRGRFAGARRTKSWTLGFIRGFRRAADPVRRFFRERALDSAGHDRQHQTRERRVDRRRGGPEPQPG